MKKERLRIKKQRVVNVLIWGIFQSALLHVTALQSDVTLFSRALKGNDGATSRTLASTNAVAGLAGLLLNQIGGKLSDAVGRKPFFVIGPLMNIACGLAIMRHSSSVLVLSVARVLRFIFITLSGSVMCQASLADVCSGPEMALVTTKGSVSVGIAVITGPYLESLALKLSNGNPLAPFKLMMALSFMQLVNYAGLLPETLLKKKKMDSVWQSVASLNPFAFLRLYFCKNSALKKLIAIQTLQSCVDGRVTSDLVQMWMKNNLQWTPAMSRNFIVFWGLAVAGGGAFIHPFMLKHLSTFAYSTVGNLFVGTGLAMHGVAEKSIFMWGAVPFLVPGVNGGSAHAIKALSLQIATREGYGNGEFSAWISNMRTLAQSLQMVLVGVWYARCRERAHFRAGTSWFLVSFVGAALPQLLMMTMPHKDFELPSKASPHG